jgi:integrase/recombinase XerD
MMSKKDCLGEYAESFLTSYLAQERGSSANTISSYFICIKLLFLFCSQHLRKKIEKLRLKDIEGKMVLTFLDYLEAERGNLPQTRNVRLACLHSFFSYVALQDPTMLVVCTRIAAIKPKKVAHKVLPSLTKEQVDAFISVIEPHNLWGLRDHALFLLLYNTGARVSEIVDLKVEDLRMEEPYHVSLTGKGNKQRYVCLWEKTVKAIKLYLDHRNPHYNLSSLILNTRGMPISRYGIGYIVKKYHKLAQIKCPSLHDINVTPHTFRHTFALHNVAAGTDISVVRDLLGHTSVETTESYYRISMEMKKKNLESFHPPKDASTLDSMTSLFNKPSILERLDKLCHPPSRSGPDSQASPRPGPY